MDDSRHQLVSLQGAGSSNDGCQVEIRSKMLRIIFFRNYMPWKTLKSGLLTCIVGEISVNRAGLGEIKGGTAERRQGLLALLQMISD